MATYNYQTQGKTAANFKAKSDQKVEGTLELAPNVDYNVQEVYSLHGLGKVFDGKYRIKKLTKRVDISGMSVTAEVVKL